MSGLASTAPGSQTLANGQGSSDMSTAAGMGSGSAVSTPGAAAQPGVGASSQGASATGRPNYSVVPNSQGAAAAQSGTSAAFQTRSQQIYAQVRRAPELESGAGC